MKVLVTAASKHGGTWEIAEAIGLVLRQQGLETNVLAPDDVASVVGYDAVVLGSGVYAARWLGPARELVRRAADEFADRQVWLFSSGPIGDPPKPQEDPEDIPDIMQATGAHGHRLFAGRLVRARLTFLERTMAVAMRVPDGDYRDWTGIRTWAAGIAEAVRAEASRSTHAPRARR